MSRKAAEYLGSAGLVRLIFTTSSRVRQVMGTGFPGGTYRQVFYVADVEASGPPMDGELHADLDEADFLAIFPLAGKGSGPLDRNGARRARGTRGNHEVR